MKINTSATLFIAFSMITGNALAGFFGSPPPPPCALQYQKNAKIKALQLEGLKEEYKQLTHLDFDKQETDKSSVGAAAGAFACLISSAVTIASGGTAIMAPMIACTGELLAGNGIDYLNNKDREKKSEQSLSLYEQKVKELTEKIALKIVEAVDSQSAYYIVNGRSYEVYRAIIAKMKQSEQPDEHLLPHQHSILENLGLEQNPSNGEDFVRKKLEHANRVLARSASNSSLCTNGKLLTLTELVNKLLILYHELPDDYEKRKKSMEELGLN